MEAPAATTTSLSRMARVTNAFGSMTARSKTTESTTCAPDSIFAHGPSTLRSRCEPEITLPSDTIESMVTPSDPRPSRTSFAGGELSCWLKIGHQRL